MKARDVTPGAILLTRKGGCLTPQATSFLEVMSVYGDDGNGTLFIVGRACSSAESNYRPFALYGDGIELRIRPEFCDLERKGQGQPGRFRSLLKARRD